jgi:hypothetical protein
MPCLRVHANPFVHPAFGSSVLAGEPSLVDKILAMHKAFEEAEIAHAFGGALALAFYTQDPRATADIDVNVSVDSRDAQHVFRALPTGVAWDHEDLKKVGRDDQIRIWWGRTPVDLFFQASPFHIGVAKRSVSHHFAGEELPFLSANDLAVFKALFDRPKDWLDIEAMLATKAVNPAWVASTLESLLGEDPRIRRLLDLTIL